MAAVDPKDILKRNIPLVVAYVVALAAIPVWYFVVLEGVKGDRRAGFQAEADKLKRNKGRILDFHQRVEALKNAGDAPEGEAPQPVYTERHVEALKKEKELTEAQLQSLQQLVRERDQKLEQWFEKYKELEPGKLPDPNDYITHYRTKIAELIEEFRSVVVVERGGEPKVYTVEPNAKQLKVWQKRYWIQRAIFSALKAADPRVKLLQAPDFTVEGTAPTPDSQRPVEPIRVRVVLLAPLPAVPVALKELLAQEVCMQVNDMTVEKAPFFYEQPELNMTVDGRNKVFEDVYYTARLEGHNAFKGEENLEEYIPEPPVKVTLSIDVLDFNVAPPPPAKEE